MEETKRFPRQRSKSSFFYQKNKLSSITEELTHFDEDNTRQRSSTFTSFHSSLDKSKISKEIETLTQKADELSNLSIPAIQAFLEKFLKVKDYLSVHTSDQSRHETKFHYLKITVQDQLRRKIFSLYYENSHESLFELRQTMSSYLKDAHNLDFIFRSLAAESMKLGDWNEIWRCFYYGPQDQQENDHSKKQISNI